MDVGQNSFQLMLFFMSTLADQGHRGNPHPAGGLDTIMLTKSANLG
jgi:hypothetical protein